MIAHPPAETTLKDRDEIYVVGNSAQLPFFETTIKLPRFCRSGDLAVGGVKESVSGGGGESGL